jgi:hypothetical protein
MIPMTPEVRAIAQRLADAINTQKSRIAEPCGSANTRMATPGMAIPEHDDPTSLIVAWPARPLNREERAVREEGQRRLRDFFVSRHYARLRLRERRAARRA